MPSKPKSELRQKIEEMLNEMCDNNDLDDDLEETLIVDDEF